MLHQTVGLRTGLAAGAALGAKALRHGFEKDDCIVVNLGGLKHSFQSRLSIGYMWGEQGYNWANQHSLVLVYVGVPTSELIKGKCS